MRTSLLRSQLYHPLACTQNPIKPVAKPPILIPFKTITSKNTLPSRPRTILRENHVRTKLDVDNKNLALDLRPMCQKPSRTEFTLVLPDGESRLVLVGSLTVGFLLLFMSMDEHRALALGPQGPLVEEFWENMRRYALYALTVSTGALYTILQPILELLKNPISAVLILVIFVGSIYIISQVLSAMVGVTDFTYDYAY